MHYSNCSQVMQSVKFPFIHLHTILSHQLSHGHIFSVEKLKLTQCIGLYMIMTCKIMEGLHAITAYIAFWVDFNFLQDQASFWQADLFWHEKHCSVIIVFVDLHFVVEQKQSLWDWILRKWMSTRPNRERLLLAASKALLFKWMFWFF